MKINIFYVIVFLSLSTYSQTIIEETIQYSYDDNNRLIHVIWEDEVEKMYIYDDVGNRIQLQNTGTLGLDDYILRNVITVYPNPTSNNINIKLPEDGVFFNPEIELFDMQGRLIREEKQTIEKGQVGISVFDLPGGIYLVRLNENSSSWSQLFIKK